MFDHILERYVVSLTTTGKAPATHRAIRSDLAQFCTWWEQTHLRPFDLTQVVERDLRAWKAFRQQDEGTAPATINRGLSTLRCLCAWAIEQRLLAENPTREVPDIPSTPVSPRSLPDQAVDALLRATRAEPDPRLRLRDEALLALLVYAGVRIQEACDIQLPDLDLASGTLVVRSGKGGKARRLPLHSGAQRTLSRYLQEVCCPEGLPPIGSEQERAPLLVGMQRAVAGRPLVPGIKPRVARQRIAQLRKIAKVALDPAVPDEQVRPQIFAVVPQTQLQEVYDDAGANARPEDGQTFDLLLNHYSFLRKFLPDLLSALAFTGTSAAQPVVQAITALKQMDTEGRRTLPKGVPLDFLPADWRTAIEADRASKDPKERRRAKHLWELGLAEQMRKLLRSSDLSVPGSRQHKVWTSYLHTEAAWAERKSSWFARHPAHQDAKTYLDALEERYQTLLQTVLDGWDTNDFAEIVMAY